jgi:hypothetical protein
MKAKYANANYVYKQAVGESLKKSEFDQRNLPSVFKKDQAAERTRKSGKRTPYDKRDGITKAFEKWTNGKTVAVPRDSKGRFAGKVEG